MGLIRKLAESPTSDADRLIVSYLAGQTAQAGLWPNDDELRERFITAPLYWYLTRGRLRMVLEGIEEALRTNKAESGRYPGTCKSNTSCHRRGIRIGHSLRISPPMWKRLTGAIA